MCLLLPCRYGSHLSKEEAAELVAPHPDTLELVHSWLAHHGVQPSSISITHGGNWLTLTCIPVLQANELLGASYQLYQHSGKNDTAILRTVVYALPTVLHTHVRTVVPTTFFTSASTPQQTLRILSAGEVEALAKAAPREPMTTLSRREIPEMVTPDFLRWLYKTFAYFPRVPTRNSLGMMGYKYEIPIETALTSFMSLFRREAQNPTFRVEPVDNGDIQPGPSLEANLEMEYAQAIAFPTQHIFYATSSDRYSWFPSTLRPAPGDLFLEWMGHVLSLEDIPQTIMTSYGVLERYVPPDYAWDLCNLFAILGVRGVTVLSATGDHGVGAGDCIDHFGNVRFMARFPSTCTCDIYLPSSSTQAQVRVDCRISTVLQVRGLLASVGRRVHSPRLRRTCPGAASRAISPALNTRTLLLSPFLALSATGIRACTSSFLP